MNQINGAYNKLNVNFIFKVFKTILTQHINPPKEQILLLHEVYNCVQFKLFKPVFNPLNY